MAKRRRDQEAHLTRPLPEGEFLGQHVDQRPVSVDDALGAAGRAPGVPDVADVVRVRLNRQFASVFQLRGGEKVDAEPRRTERQQSIEGAASGQPGRALTEARRIDNKRADPSVVEDEDVVVFRPERMQRRIPQAEYLRRLGDGDDVGCVARQQRDGVTAPQAARLQGASHLVRPLSQVCVSPTDIRTHDGGSIRPALHGEPREAGDSRPLERRFGHDPLNCPDSEPIPRCYR